MRPRYSIEDREEFKQSPKASRDLNNVIDTAFDEGKEEGKAVGIELGVELGVEKKTIEIIKQGRKMGMSDADLSKLTGLSEGEICKII